MMSSKRNLMESIDEGEIEMQEESKHIDNAMSIVPEEDESTCNSPKGPGRL